MNRRDMLRGFGAFGLGSLLPGASAFPSPERAEAMRSSSTCFLTPQETEGPYYFDPDLLRQDITSDTTTGIIKSGMSLGIGFSVIDFNCNPIPNVLVDIWHCDKDGIYSGYAGQPGGISTVGQNFLRGIQVTDANGQCAFTTIYPGWYPSRVTHVHFKVRLTSATYVTSQFAFPDSANAAVYSSPAYATHGQNSLTNATDSVFQQANPEHELLILTPNAATGGYDGAITVGINAPTDVQDAPSAPGTFALRPNFPNPFNPSTTISYDLASATDVTVTIHDVLGREVARLVDGRQTAGVYEVIFNAGSLASGFYFCKLVAGPFVKTREMLLLR